MIAYEGLRHDPAALDAAIILIGLFCFALLYLAWRNGPALRREIHGEMHKHKSKANQWLKDPDYYAKKRKP